MKTIDQWRDQIMQQAQGMLRPRVVVGLALGDKSLLAAEASATPNPRVTLLEEFVYPAGITPQQPAELGAALEKFLKEKGFTAKAAVVGIPVRWLLVRRKEVPPSDEATLIELLRLGAEAEFTTEIKDLVYDFVRADAAGDSTDAEKPADRAVLLMGTQKHNVEAAAALCKAAHLRPLAVTASALVVGEATAGVGTETMVLSASAGGSELSMQHGPAPIAIRYLRAPDPQPPFLSELRRAVSTMTGPGRRDMVLWDAAGGMDPEQLGTQLGLRVRSGQLAELGVEIAAGAAQRNGEASKYAAAVALARSGLGGKQTVDFLHSRLAPPKEMLIPRWAMIAGAATLLVLIYALWCYVDMSHQEQQLAALNATIANTKDELTAAQAFVAKVSFAQNWQGGQPRYLACVRDLTSAVTDDGDTYATTLSLRESNRSGAPPAAGKAAMDSRALSGQLAGRSSDQQRIERLIDRIKHTHGFSDVTLVGTQNVVRERSVTFSITFTYSPAQAAAQ
jgi:hypothetical protein